MPKTIDGYSVTSIGDYSFSDCSSLTIFAEVTIKPEAWDNNWNYYNRPMICGCTLSTDKSYVVSFTMNYGSIGNSAAKNGTSAPCRIGYTFVKWLGSDGQDYASGNVTNAPNGVTLTAVWMQN